MSGKALIFACGLVIGATVTLVGSRMAGDDPVETDDPAVTRLTASLSDLTEERDALQATLEEERETHREALLLAEQEMEAMPVAPVPDVPTIVDEPVEVAAAGPPTSDEIEAALKKFGPQLQSIILGHGDEAVAELRAFFARVPLKDLNRIIDHYGEVSDMGEKIVLAHALAQSGRPEAIEALRKIVLDRNRAFLDRRFVSHDLAFVDDPELHPLLLEVGQNDPDRGARANASFGLARAGVEEGYELYAKATDDAFAAKDPAAMQYLSGFMLLGKKAMPQVRERLETYQDPQTRVMLIEMVKKEKDRESLPALYRLSNDLEAGQSVQEAARRAIELISAPDEGE